MGVPDQIDVTAGDQVGQSLLGLQVQKLLVALIGLREERFIAIVWQHHIVVEGLLPFGSRNQIIANPRGAW